MSKFNLRFVSCIGRFLTIALGKSIRIRNVGDIPHQRVIYALWHDSFFPLIYAYRFHNIAVLISSHRDGEYLTRIIKPFGYKVIRGSSADKGARGFLELLKLNKSASGGSFAIAPDGPIGPRHRIKEGVLKLAEITKLPIIPVGVSISKKIQFNSWDRFNLPLPFSKCIICWGSPFLVREPTEHLRKKLESVLIEINAYAKLCL
ncbi:lysophospholipid acyltransferase family protein [candidate division WOR-3 bacterium]|nr:lysophospholipid acyltransferase family protein [candidate division WOR-3 bacterium]